MEMISIILVAGAIFLGTPAAVVISAMAYKVGVTLLGKGSELQES